MANVLATNKVVSVVASALVGAAIAVPLALAGVQGVKAADSSAVDASSVDACVIKTPEAVDAGHVLAAVTSTGTTSTTSTGVTGGNGNSGSSGNATNGSVNTSNNNNSGIGVQDVLDLSVGDVNVLNNLLNGNSILNNNDVLSENLNNVLNGAQILPGVL